MGNARTALKLALQQIPLTLVHRILVPDFVCDVLLHPIIRAGFLPEFYPLIDNLSPDWDRLESIASEASCCAIIMVHYFGQPQDIERFRSFCAYYNLLLIEDNAHGYGGYLGGKPLGGFGNFGISSPRKFLGTPSGGILHGVSTESSELLKSISPFPICRPFQLSKSAIRMIPGFESTVRALINRHSNWDDPRLFRESLKPDYGIDCFSYRRIVNADWPHLAYRRREVWSDWSIFIDSVGLVPVFSNVHPESNPWALPVYAKSVEERNLWLRWGAFHRISIFPWPSLPEQVILSAGGALDRWSKLLCFPLAFRPKSLNILVVLYFFLPLP